MLEVNLDSHYPVHRSAKTLGGHCLMALRQRSIRTLIVPGLGNSGPGHWQFTWRANCPGFEWLEQRDWHRPARQAWCESLERFVSRASQPVVLVAHSLGCTTVAHWALSGCADRILGAMLVAPADADKSIRLAQRTSGFAPMPLARLPFRSVVVASRNDPYVSFWRARHFADCWGSAFIDAGELGHINGDSNLGNWPTGMAILLSLIP